MNCFPSEVGGALLCSVSMELCIYFAYCWSTFTSGMASHSDLSTYISDVSKKTEGQVDAPPLLFQKVIQNRNKGEFLQLWFELMQVFHDSVIAEFDL